MNAVRASVRQFIRSLQPHPLQQAHLLEVGAGVGQPLQCVCQVIVSAEVEAVCSQHIVNHGQEGLILLRLKEDRKKQPLSFLEKS